jgi:hypothetical protein
MPSTRKPRSDSIAAQTRIAQNADKVIESPIALEGEEQVIFDGLIAGLPADAWDPHMVRAAARLAKLECYLETLIDDAIQDGPISVNARGTETMNPIHSAMTQTSSTVKMLRGSLGLNRNSSSKDPNKAQDKKAKAAVSKLKAVGGKDLLA